MCKQIFLILITISLFMASCTKNLSGLNVNPKAFPSVPAVTLFTRGEMNLVDDYTSTSVGSAPFRVLAQEWTENNYIYEAQYNFSAYNAPNGWWNNLYQIALANLVEAKKYYSRDVLDPIEINNDNIITDILEVYAFDMLVATYGPIPYSEAFNDSIPFPKYDDEKTIYTDLLLRLDTCIAGINTSGASMGNADQIYFGNMTEWKKFAATLKLKIAMRLADVDPTTASQKVLEAINAGVFTSNKDNASMPFKSTSPSTNASMLWQALVYSGRHDFCPANYLVNTMLEWNDPRLPLYFSLDKSGNYSGGVPGQGNSYGTFSTFSAQMLDPSYPGTILNYSQAEFLQAEAAERGFITDNPAAHYDSAVTASIKFWGDTAAADAAAYLAQPEVAYATAAGTWQQKLGYQEWIANYNMNWDSWTDIRRLGYPDLNTVNPPVRAQGNLPLRYTYPSNESGSNKTNYDNGVSMLKGGEDLTSGKLYWMK